MMPNLKKQSTSQSQEYHLQSQETHVPRLSSQDQSIYSAQSISFRNQKKDYYICLIILLLISPLNACDAGSYDDGTGNCVFCNSTCTACTQSANNCSACATGYYFINSLYLCAPCDSSCSTCFGGSIYDCTQCLNGVIGYTTKTCSSQCPPGEYNTPQNTCALCLATSCAVCNAINSSICTTCSTNYVLLLNYTCSSSCPTQTFLNTPSQSCSSCSSNCLQCSSTSTNCTSCPLNTYLSTSTCVTTCNPGSYADTSTNKCLVCDSTCANCKVTSTNCTSCTANLYLFNNSCIQSCPVATYAAGNTCLLCSTECKTCIDSTHCTNCMTAYYLLNSSCYSACPAGYFANTSTGNCNQCSANCLTCNSSGCISCQPTFYLNSSAFTCNSQCSSGYYADNTTSACKVCNLACASCLDSTNITCSVCSSNYYLRFNSTICDSSCPLGQYALLGTYTCKACLTNCQTCQSSTQCLTCFGFYYLYNSTCTAFCPIGLFANQLNGKCDNCNSSCSTCSITSNNCTSCASNMFFDVTSSPYSCKSVCNRGYFGNPSNMQCQICASTCYTCSILMSNCTSCTGSLNLFNNTCISSCPAITYLDLINNICQSCPSGCLTCTNLTTCLNCTPNLYLLNATCVSVCLSGYYHSNNQCFQCDKSCSVCTGPTNISCTQCSNGYFIGLNTTICDSLCPISQFLFQNQSCQYCSNNCLLCSNNSSCIKCSTNYTYSTIYGYCVLQCLSNQFFNYSSGKCQNCDSGCTNCALLSTNCTNCATQYLLFNETTCISSCPAYFFNNTNVCSACAVGCSSCTNNQSTSCLSCGNVTNNLSTSYYFKSSTACVLNCPTGQFGDNSSNSCLACDIGCSSCSLNSSNCFSCQSTNLQIYFYDSNANKCVTSCLGAYYGNIYTKLCQLCIYYLYNNTCLTQCPSGTGPGLGNTCSPCSVIKCQSQPSIMLTTTTDGNHFNIKAGLSSPVSSSLKLSLNQVSVYLTLLSSKRLLQQRQLTTSIIILNASSISVSSDGKSINIVSNAVNYIDYTLYQVHVDFPAGVLISTDGSPFLLTGQYSLNNQQFIASYYQAFGINKGLWSVGIIFFILSWVYLSATYYNRTAFHQAFHFILFLQIIGLLRFSKNINDFDKITFLTGFSYGEFNYVINFFLPLYPSNYSEIASPIVTLINGNNNLFRSIGPLLFVLALVIFVLVIIYSTKLVNQFIHDICNFVATFFAAKIIFSCILTFIGFNLNKQTMFTSNSMMVSGVAFGTAFLLLYVVLYIYIVKTNLEQELYKLQLIPLYIVLPFFTTSPITCISIFNIVQLSSIVYDIEYNKEFMLSNFNKKIKLGIHIIVAITYNIVVLVQNQDLMFVLLSLCVTTVLVLKGVLFWRGYRKIQMAKYKDQKLDNKTQEKQKESTLEVIFQAENIKQKAQFKKTHKLTDSRSELNQGFKTEQVKHRIEMDIIID